MADILPNLTSEERAIMEIAAQGESIAAIGLWENGVNHLVELGFLHRLNRSNNMITPKGRELWSMIEDEPYREMAEAIQKVVKVQGVALISDPMLGAGIGALGAARTQGLSDRDTVALIFTAMADASRV